MRIEGVSTSVNSNYTNEQENNTQKAFEQDVNKDNSFKGIRNVKEQNDRANEDNLIKKIEQANKEIIIYDHRFEFEIHEDTKRIMVRVIDVNSEKIIKEIPPEKVLDLVATMWELSGIFVDETV